MVFSSRYIICSTVSNPYYSHLSVVSTYMRKALSKTTTRHIQSIRYKQREPPHSQHKSLAQQNKKPNEQKQLDSTVNLTGSPSRYLNSTTSEVFRFRSRYVCIWLFRLHSFCSSSQLFIG